MASPSIVDEATKKYGFLKKHNFAQIVTPQEGRGYAETWPAGEVGGEDYPRPQEIPLDRNGVQIFQPDKFTIDDIAGEAMHIDPQAQEVRKNFYNTLTPSQFSELRRQPDYMAGNVDDERRIQNAVDAAMRGYVVNQWPKEAVDTFFTPDQRAMLDGLKQYMTQQPEN